MNYLKASNADENPNAKMKREPKPSEKFREALKLILSVPKEEILRREAEYKRQRALQKASRRPSP